MIPKTIKKRDKEGLGHILRRDYIQRRIMEGKMEGIRSRGRRKFGILTDIAQGRSINNLKKMFGNV